MEEADESINNTNSYQIALVNSDNEKMLNQNKWLYNNDKELRRC